MVTSNFSSLKRAELPALTGIRFFAAMYVVCFHFAPAAPWNTGLVEKFISHGNLSVEVFFVLSGFILTYVHDQAKNMTPVERRKFWSARFARIYPVYFLAMVLFSPFIYGRLMNLHGSSANAYMRLTTYGVAASTLLQAWAPKLAVAWNIPGWSLSAEAFFYACFPFILPRLHRLPMRRLILLGVALWVASVIPHWIYFSLPEHLQQIKDIENIPEFNPLLRIAEFIGGMVIARGFLEGYRLKRGADAAAFVALLAFVGTLIFCSRTGIMVLVFPEVALLIFLLAQVDGALSWVLGSAPVKLLGEASYAIYILQLPVYLWFLRFIGHAVTEVLPTVYFVCYLAILTVLSIFVFRFIEKPSARWIRRRGVKSVAVDLAPNASTETGALALPKFGADLVRQPLEEQQ